MKKILLQKLLYTFCVLFLLVSCEETYHDKLFWPREVSQEYGLIVNSNTLAMTYSGDTLVGKTVAFRTADCKEGVLTLNHVVPGEDKTLISVKLYEKEEVYAFTGEELSGQGARVKYKGSVTPKQMILSLEVEKPQRPLNYSYRFADVTRGKRRVIAANHTVQPFVWEWTEQNEMLLTSAIYAHADAELTEQGSIATTMNISFQSLLGYILPQLIRTVSFQPDGNIRLDFSRQPIAGFDFAGNQQASIQNIIRLFMSRELTPEDMTMALRGRSYSPLPRNLAFWHEADGKILVLPNLPAIIQYVIENRGGRIDPQFIAGVAEAILKADPERLKRLLAVVDEQFVKNEWLELVAGMDSETLSGLLSLLKEGIPLCIQTTPDGHTLLYLDKHTLTPLLKLCPRLAPLVANLLPEDLPMKALLTGILKQALTVWPDAFLTASRFDLGLDLIVEPNNTIK